MSNNHERGLPYAPVTVWVYDGSLKVEHQAVTLSTYRVEQQDDHKRLQAVSNPRLANTPFRSPQLTLFDLGPHEWLLYWRTPDYAPTRRKRRVEGLVQPLLFDLERVEKALGANEASFTPSLRSQLHLVKNPSETEEQ